MIDEPAPRRGEDALRALVPRVLAGLVRRGEDFGAAEDALQEALLEALRVWPEHPPRDQRAWLTTVVSRVCLDMLRARATRHEEPLDVLLESLLSLLKMRLKKPFFFCCCAMALGTLSV